MMVHLMYMLIEQGPCHDLLEIVMGNITNRGLTQKPSRDKAVGRVGAFDIVKCLEDQIRYPLRASYMVGRSCTALIELVV